MAPSVPPSLKKIKVFLTRATELDRDKGNPESRVVAFNCRQFAVLTGIPLAQDIESKTCLGDLLNLLEKEKEAMAVFNKAEHWNICRKVADRVFEKADVEDRAGAATKATAKSFYAAGTFYEILQQFHEEKKDADGTIVENNDTKSQIEEEDQKRVYCKWKATDILNAIKEGRTPTPGGYQQEEMALPLVGEPIDTGSAPNSNWGMSTINEGLPPAPSMPSSDMFGSKAETEVQDADVPPPAYNRGIELNLNGDPTPTTVADEHYDDVEEVFIPGAVKAAAATVTEPQNVFVEPPPVAVPPPPYPDESFGGIAPLGATHSASASRVGTNSGGMFSSIFGKTSKKKLSKNEMSDASELTKFALAALQNGDGELGRQRLEQALGVWNK